MPAFPDSGSASRATMHGYALQALGDSSAMDRDDWPQFPHWDTGIKIKMS